MKLINDEDNNDDNIDMKNEEEIKEIDESQNMEEEIWAFSIKYKIF